MVEFFGPKSVACYPKSAAAAGPALSTLREAVHKAKAPLKEVVRGLWFVNKALRIKCLDDSSWNIDGGMAVPDGIPRNVGVFRVEGPDEIVVCEWGDFEFVVELKGDDGGTLWLLPGMLLRKIVDGKDLFMRLIGLASFVVWSAVEGLEMERSSQSSSSLESGLEKMGVAPGAGKLLQRILTQLRAEIRIKLDSHNKAKQKQV